ncbi:von Willebrand factor type A domain protein [Ostertagia ostertagi]
MVKVQHVTYLELEIRMNAALPTRQEPNSDEAKKMRDRLFDALTKPVQFEHTTASHEETAEPESGETSTAGDRIAGPDRTTTEDNYRDTVTPPLGMDHITSRPDAISSEARKSIVFLLDARMLAIKDGWKNMVDLVVRTVGRMKQTRVAVIAMSCPSKVIVPMGIYTSDYLRSQSLAFKSDGNKIATSQAYRLAKKLLDAETTKDKSVAVFSDGQSSTCDIPGTGDKDERSVADKMRQNGTNIVMVPTGKPANKTNVEDIAEDPSNVLDTKHGMDVTARTEFRRGQENARSFA